MFWVIVMQYLKYMKSYDKDKPSKYIIYEDANNAYEWEMSQYLPIGRFEWVKMLISFI